VISYSYLKKIGVKLTFGMAALGIAVVAGIGAGKVEKCLPKTVENVIVIGGSS
jgi:hypothetical protein